MRILLSLLVVFALVSCKKQASNTSAEDGETVKNASASQQEPITKSTPETCTNEISQGVQGKVVFLEGDHMPSPEGEPKKGSPVVREILIFTPIKKDQLNLKDDGFFIPGEMEPIKKAISSKDGCFNVALPVGVYSVLINEPDNGWFANVYGGGGVIQPLEVKQDKVTQMDIKIDYAASY